MNGDMVRRSAPPRALEVASWSHRAPRLAIGRSERIAREFLSAQADALGAALRLDLLTADDFFR
jgi:hypothetical protein